MKKITLDRLATIVEEGFKKTQKGFKKAAADTEQLAIMVQKGFEEMENRMAKKEDLYALTDRVGRLEERVEYGFDMVAQKFKEIDFRADILDLQFRVSKIEKKSKM
jgi:tRNA(Leu) C34 or U34 (ribose-2'-O)-methylase TrmL